MAELAALLPGRADPREGAGRSPADQLAKLAHLSGTDEPSDGAVHLATLSRSVFVGLVRGREHDKQFEVFGDVHELVLLAVIDRNDATWPDVDLLVDDSQPTFAFQNDVHLVCHVRVLRVRRTGGQFVDSQARAGRRHGGRATQEALQVCDQRYGLHSLADQLLGHLVHDLGAVDEGDRGTLVGCLVASASPRLWAAPVTTKALPSNRPGNIASASRLLDPGPHRRLCMVGVLADE